MELRPDMSREAIMMDLRGSFAPLLLSRAIIVASQTFVGILAIWGAAITLD